MSKKLKRQTRILNALKNDPTKRVVEFAEELNVSTETIRRDLAELDAEGSVRRIYGGAVRAATQEAVLSERLKLHIRQREAIAETTVSLLQDVRHIVIGGGATTLHFARALRSVDRRMTILTASFEIAQELSSNPLFDVIFLPGNVENREGMVYGAETVRFIYEYYVQVAIIGASAIDEIGVSEALPAAAEIYRAMISQAEQTIVVADDSKLRKSSLKRVLKWNSRSTLVTNTAIPDSFLQSLQNNGVTTVFAKDTG